MLPDDDEFSRAREAMLAEQLRAKGIHATRVLDAFRAVPRHEFVPVELRGSAYSDQALPIGHEQTISQPYMVAFMIQLLELSPDATVLEIGTGSGYQTAILSLLVRQVFSLERHRELASRAARRLTRLRYSNIDIHVGDGSQGLPDMAPFDAIIVSAAAPRVPGPLQAQLSANGGRLVLPVGAQRQHLELVTRQGQHWERKRVMSVKFVPLIGRYGFKSDV